MNTLGSNKRLQMSEFQHVTSNTVANKYVLNYNIKLNIYLEILFLKYFSIFNIYHLNVLNTMVSCYNGQLEAPPVKNKI